MPRRTGACRSSQTVGVGPQDRLGYIDRMQAPREFQGLPSATRARAAPRAVQQRDRIAGLEKGLLVIEAVDDERLGQTIADVAALTRAPRPCGQCCERPVHGR